jgi:acyl transferase domain-containing protein/SAM-dependent methyltransferase
VNLDLHQANFDINHQGGALSADGVCRAFGKGANGYVMGEGIGALLLKPLGQAIRDGDNIYGVIKSAILNHGGRTSGYTVPNPKAQADLIASAIEKAEIDARSIGYIEAHGTGTELGDPIEITGLNNAFQSSTVENRSCAIGSLKTNIGHLEAAAGVVSVSKVLLQMRHRQLVPSLHSSELNDFIDFEHSPFYVVQRLEEWNGREVDGVRLPLRAGISSFGAGGSNAHVILESYDPIRQPNAEPDRARQLIFPLSARTEEQLRQAAVRLAAFLEEGPVDLSDAAYTLQCGRKSFEHRLAILARTREELVENLACFIDVKKSQDVVTGQAKGGEAITRLLNRRQKQEFIQLVSQGADPHKIAGLWAEGLLSDWQGFQSSGKRISLPTYPFADKRHWAFEKSAVPRAALQTAGVHPMVDSNESTFERQLFKKTFTERDFFIYDHHVSDIATLPGVAYLELARKAGELAAGRKVQRIKNILWISPIALQAGSSKEVFIELKPSGNTVQFEVFSQVAGGEKMPHSQGKLLYATREEAAAEPEYLDLERVRARTAKVIDGATVYPLFKSFGLNLGPSFQVLQNVYKNEIETLGALTLPKFREGDLQSMVLLPSLVDGSLQAGMAAQLGGQVGEMFVPFSIGEVEILHPLQSNCFSYVTEVKDDHKRGTSRVLKSNVLIVDETGKVLVKIHDSVGVPLREIHKKPASNADGDGFSKLYYSYDWQRAPLADDAKRNAPRSVVLFDTEETLRDLIQERLREAQTSADHVILVRPGETFHDLGGQSYTVSPRSKDDFTQLFRSLVDKGIPIENICFAWPSGSHDLQESLGRGVYSLLFVCQSLIECKLENAVQLLYLYSGTEDDWQLHDAAMTGFINTLHLEHPKLICKTVEVRQENAGREQMMEAMSAELFARTQDATAVRYDALGRHIKKLQAFDLAEEASDASDAAALKVRENGVYLITGGAGGLGLIFAEFLAKQYRARLVLTGRSAPSAELEARLEELRKSGAEVLYLSADVSSHDDVRKVVDECRSRHGVLHGIIHAAGVLRDSLIRNKTPQEMSAVFAPKVHGTVHLDELTKDQDLDFFVTFSSLAAVAGNAGQSDYSFANHFMDSFAAKRELLRGRGARSGKTLSLNWSLWADGGMKLDKQTELFFKKTLGISPLSAATGLDAFVRGLASPRSQFAVLEGVQEKVELAWGLRKKPAAPAAPAAAPVASQTVSAPAADLTARLQNDLTHIVMELLKVDADDVPLDKILLDLGFDSIGLTTFANAVNEKYQLDITPVLFFDYPTLGEIAKHLCTERKTEIAQFYHGAAGVATMAAQPPATQHHAEAGTSHQEARLEIRKGWDPAALDQVPAAAASGVGISPELRFINDPIAIVGMSGVMPQSDDLREFWDNLASSKDMISVIPPDRWRWEDYYGDPLKEINKSNSKWGGFMNEVDKFDPLFFGISPREAQMMDPQQRIFLEHAWKAIEDSGQKVSDLSGTKTGVFVGVATTDYTDVLRGQEIALDGYSASGNSHSVLANRVSFLLNLRGPSAPIDTACSSSLIALHRAIESIHTGSSDMAIVGGVHVMLSPAAYISFGMAGMLSGDGKCKTFDKRANGYVRGEGCGAIFIKRLSAAVADGNHIYALIKATAENHGGRVTTMTAPNSAAQTELIVEAYEKAHVDPATVGFIECHGTGTPLGDPIEIQALSKAFSELYKKNNMTPAATPHCGLSSVKTNIGHLETAAGIAGLLKTVLAIKHKQIPANIHLEEVNPYINLKGTPFYIADRLTPWQAAIGADGSPTRRTAGVSSFGFGGANVHVVLEEYVSSIQDSSAAYGPQLIVLSAKNEDRLGAYVRSMLAALDRDDVDLRDFAYTLQVGRDEMPERLALVASSTADLKRKLEEILRGGERPKESFRGNIKSKEAKSLAADGPEGEILVRDLIERKELSRLAELWVCGAKIDWRGLHDSGAPRRISIPTYPFARERHWIPITKKTVNKEQGQELTATARLHPLIHRNVSTLEEQKFSSRFSGQEFYLADHVVETQRMLPGVAYLEMARAAGELSGNAKVRVIRNLTWERPLVVNDGGTEVEVSLVPFKDEVKFAVKSVTGQSAITHCTGRLGYQLNSSQPEVLDIARIKERCSEQVLSGKELYPFLSQAGLKLGPSFQIVQSISANESESLAILQLPEHLRQDADLFWLHPALMDGSLHTAIGLAKTNGMDVSSNLPYSVGEVQILHPLRDLHYGYATWAVDDPKASKNVLKVTFHLLDENGRVLVRIKDFVSRPFRRGSVEAAVGVEQEHAKAAEVRETAQAGLQSLVPVWSPVRVAPSARVVVPETSKVLVCGADQSGLDWVRKSCPSSELLELEANSGIEAIEQKIGDRTFDQLLWIAPDVRVRADDYAGSDELLVEKQEAGVVAIFRLIKALLQLGYAARKLQWTIVISRTQRLPDGAPMQPAHSGIVGLLGSLAKEHPQWDLRLLDIESLDAVSARECLSLPWDKQGNVLAHRNGEWFQQSLAVMPAQPQAAPLYRQNGVYVVIGGAGGVGEVWSRFMIQNHQANVVWIGRRERDVSIDAKIESLGRIGPAPLYLTADATDVAALEQARRTILESHPAIHGVVHSAIVLEDQTVARMDETAFRASLSAKVDVSVNIDRVFGPDALDFMLFFSSIISFVKSPGQSNYSAGCTFKDSFALRLQQRRAYPVKIMNWGYWGNVGVVAGESYNRNMASMGIGSIEPDEGMASLQVLVGSEMPQLVLLKTLTSQAGAGLNLSEAVVQYPRTTPPILAHLQPSLAEQFADAPTAHLEVELPTAEMTDFATEIFASSLMSLGLFRDGIRALSELSVEKPPPPYYERWLSSSIDYLQQQHILAGDLTFQREIRALPDLWTEWEVKRSVWGTAPNVQAQISLVEACLKALPAVLSGRQLATDVIFPKSSMQLVEGIYRDNVLADHFNDVLGRTLKACIEQRLRMDGDSEIRILEIGAGTGGTTAKLLPLLQQYPIAEYCYTDVSRAFLMYAEKNYRPQFPALTTAIFDVSKPLASQSIAAGRFDFTIAANVLHATPDIRETLRNTKATLKKRGVLLLNEMSSWSLFNHLTFGLLEGWWLHQDAALRLRGSPGLAPRKWQDVLLEEGFESIVFPAEKTHRFGQQIVAAESNGWSRQRIVKAAPQERPAAAASATANATDVHAARDAKPVVHPSPSRASNEQMSNEQMTNDYIKQIITRQLSDALKMDAAMIHGDAPFADYGVDSIIGVNFVRTVSEALQIELETTSLFEYSTVDDLTRYIATNWKQQMAEQSASLRNESQGPVPVAEAMPDKPTELPVRTESRFARRGSFAEAEAGGDDKSRENGAEPIAIIGMSGRFAESESLDAFWRNLTEGKDLVKEVSRWRAADCVMSESAGQTYCSRGSFIDSIDEFDPAFFGISAEEAVVMDPQQRLFLEESWKALEDAGYAGKSVNEKQCGVYVGCGSSNYDRLFLKEPPPQAFWGNSDAVVPARIAYHLNLRGPAISIDTACSSSLVAIHLACQGLWTGETEMALAGGVFLQVTPGFHQVANRAGMLSPDGKCRSFDASANGFVPGDGVGLVVLKRLRDALADGDHVHGVIAGSGINQDGSSNGLIAPNGRAQERLERSVYDRFKINPESIQVVEAHGTGTLLGDSIEYAAISRAFREYTGRKQFCALGTVKTNIGHAATAAGIAGVLKLLLALKHRQIPPSLHFQKGNPAMDLESGPFYVNTQLTEWRAGEDQRRRAAISSFGFSGTNAHLVIEEAPPIGRPSPQAPGYVVALSARTPEQLKARVRALLALAAGTPDLSMNDLSFTLFVGRMHFTHRLACLARNREELILGLERWMEGGTPSNVYMSEVHASRRRERVALTKFGTYCIQECRNATDASGYLENLAAIADLYAQEYALDYSSLFSRDSRRIPLPTYPFARERYWVEAAGAAAQASPADPSARLHPLLHANTSTLGQQSYRSTLTGTELLVRDHLVVTNGHGAQKVLPAAAYLEMARAAIENAAQISGAPLVVELEETVWGSPMVVAGSTQVTIDLIAGEDGGIHYEISSGDAGRPIVHCQGRAFVIDRPAPEQVNLDTLLLQMQQSAQDADGVYAAFAKMDLHYGPAHRAISTVHYGDGQLVARLLMPAVAASDADSYSLHPSLMTGALQAGLSLVAGLDGHPGAQALPTVMGRMRILSPCAGEMFAWARHAADDSLDGDRIVLDIDLIDPRGRVCVQMCGVAFPMDTAGKRPTAEGPWLFVTEADAAEEAGTIHMGAVEKIELFLRQETALQLQKPLEDIRTDQSYFDLGLSSLAMAHLIQNTNRLLGENLLPSALFDFRDIDGLASYLAAMYPAKIDALTVLRRTGSPISSGERRHALAVDLTPFPRKARLSIRSAAPSQERTSARASEPEMSREQVLEKILWQEAPLGDNYEKVAF